MESEDTADAVLNSESTIHELQSTIDSLESLQTAHETEIRHLRSSEEKAQDELSALRGENERLKLQVTSREE